MTEILMIHWTFYIMLWYNMDSVTMWLKS